MRNIESIMALEGYEVLEVIPLQKKALIIARAPLARNCLHCPNTNCRIKEKLKRRFKHCSAGQRCIDVLVKTFRLFCQLCKRSFHQRLPGCLPRMRASESLRQKVFEDHQAGHSQKHLSKQCRVSPSTVGRWTDHFLCKRLKELVSARTKCPRILGIDEHFFTRRQGFATTLTDIAGHRVFDVVLGRSENSLNHYFRSLTGKEDVKVVYMDLCDTFRSIIKKHFPHAAIVADRFHVVRLVYFAFFKIWRSIDPELAYHRERLRLLRRRSDKLSEEQRYRLQTYLKQNPVLEAMYAKREELLTLLRLKNTKYQKAKRYIPEYLRILEELRASPFVELKRLSNTLHSWSEEIMRMWRYGKSNGMTEGFHNKMELIARRAYGYRSFNNYRKRVLALCGWNEVFAKRSLARPVVPRLTV